MLNFRFSSKEIACILFIKDGQSFVGTGRRFDKFNILYVGSWWLAIYSCHQPSKRIRVGKGVFTEINPSLTREKGWEDSPIRNRGAWKHNRDDTEVRRIDPPFDGVAHFFIFPGSHAIWSDEHSAGPRA